ncbi:MAG TPA: ECF-type sigma factor, partial [Bryobacteraceae bacterium]|nr:ECF-type sigma factor [Bryobacteraceae bacterium]
MESAAGEVTRLLRAWSSGDRCVENKLFHIVLPELHKIAQQLMRKERAGHTLQPTALLNEAYLRLLDARERDWENRRHFFAIAARIMRRLLVDYGRALTLKPRARTSKNVELLGAKQEQFEEALAIDRLLDSLEQSHADWCAIVELKYFLGLTDEEAADALHLPLR